MSHLTEKTPHVAEASSTSSSQEVDIVHHTNAGKDGALVFLEQQNAVQDIHATSSQLRHLRRKVDFTVMPFLVVCFAFLFVDKVLLNYANIMGLSTSLNLRPDDFSSASAAFWIAAFAAVTIDTWLLQKVPIGKFLAGNLILWGVATAAHAGVKDYNGLVAVRIFSGIAENGIQPALMLICGQYYTRREQASRFSIWFAGMGIGQIVGGAISYGFQGVPQNAPMTGWRQMFLVIGCVTFAFGLLVIYVVPDTPMQARFLNNEQKVMLLEHTKANQSGVVNRKFRWQEIVEGCTDPQVILMCAAVLLQGTGGGTITTYSATLLKGFGYTPRQAALLNMPSGVVNLCSTLYTGFGARGYGHRWFFTVSAMSLGIAGAAIMSFSAPTNRSALTAGLYLANFFTGCTPLCFQWLTGNTTGHTKRAFATAAMAAAFAVGNIIGPYTFKAKDAPLYKPAKVSLVATWSSSAATLLLLVAYYKFANRKRTLAKGEEEDVDKSIAYAGMTDRENKHFKYGY